MRATLALFVVLTACRAPSSTEDPGVPDAAVASTPDATPFTIRPEQVRLDDVNAMKGNLSAMARGLDFSREDIVPDAIMNAMLWKAAHGEHALVPAPVRAAFFLGQAVKAKDSDD